MVGRVCLAAAFLAAALAACSDDGSSLNGGRTSASSSGSSGDPGTSSGDPGSSGSSGTSGAGSDSGASGTTPTPTGTTPEETCVAKINDYRKTKNLKPYARWDSAEACSDGQAKSDGQTSTPHGAFGTCGERAQNECPGWPGPPGTMIPKCLEAMFGEGPGGGHYDAIMGNYTKVSCGFAAAPNGQIWAVQNFL